MNNAIPKQRMQQILEVPPIEFPSCGNQTMLETKTKDINTLDDAEKKQFAMDAQRLREETKMESETDGHKKCNQPPCLTLMKTLLVLKLSNIGNAKKKTDLS